jgi:hypothetical protein
MTQRANPALETYRAARLECRVDGHIDAGRRLLEFAQETECPDLRRRALLAALNAISMAVTDSDDRGRQ